MSTSGFVTQAVADWVRITGITDTVALEVGLRVLWAGRLLEDLLEDNAKRNGLRKRGDYEVLALVRRSDPELLSPITIAKDLRLSPSGVTGKLDRLEAQGYVERRQDPNDRRGLQIALTESGRALTDAVFRAALELHRRALDGVAEADQVRLAESLAALQAALQQIDRGER